MLCIAYGLLVAQQRLATSLGILTRSCGAATSAVIDSVKASSVRLIICISLGSWQDRAGPHSQLTSTVRRRVLPADPAPRTGAPLRLHDMQCSRPLRRPAAYSPCSRQQRSAAFRSHPAAAAADRHRACPAQHSYPILYPEKPLIARIAARSSGDITETPAVPLAPIVKQRGIGAACGDDAFTPPAFQGVPLGSSGNASLLGAQSRTALTPAGERTENACTTEGPIDPAVSEPLLQSARAGTRAGSGEARAGTQRAHKGAGGVRRDEAFMRIALEEARQASSKGEIPVGAVLVRGGRVIARAHNVVETTNDPTAHAEMRVMRDAARALGAWRLLGCTLYSTLEPCPMCAGALLQARVDRVVYGARNSLLGADGSWIHMLGGVERTPAVREPAVTNAVQGSRRSRARTSVASEGASVYYIPERSVRFTHSTLLREAVRGATGEGNSTGRECLDCGGAPNQSSSNSPRGLAGLGYESAAGGGEHASASVAEDRKALHPFHPDVQVTRGILEADCARVMKDFFKRRRRKQEESGALDAAAQILSLDQD